ncbi:putative thioredoxin-like ferredoxin, Thioredoxin-like superfamily [Dioscorea sansibarensis]
MDDYGRSLPIVLSSGGADDSILSGGEPGSQAGSAAGSFQNDGLLSGSAATSGEATGISDADFGFQRPDFGRDPLVGTVQEYDRHVFLCYKTPYVWPSHLEAPESDRLPRLLSAALAARMPDIKRKTRLTICEGEDGTESSNGDILIFPDMIRYRQLTHFDVDNFVEEVLVKDTEWLSGAVETLTGSYVFVCAHGSRDRRCGVCGPVLVQKFRQEINSRGLQEQVFVSPCTHIGGHKYAGNVIIFSPSSRGEVTGHWYGYVTPDDVRALLEQHIGKGEILDHLWRGQMGMSEEEQRKVQELRLSLNSGGTDDKISSESMQSSSETNSSMNGGKASSASGCPGLENSGCCQNGGTKEKLENNPIAEDDAQMIMENKSNKESKVSNSKGSNARKPCPMPTWYECWEREDTYAVFAVVAALASVAVAYSYYRQLK